DGSGLQTQHSSSSLPGVVSPDAEPSRIGRDAFERALGVRPLLVRIGGSLPIVPALVAKGIPTIVTGFAVPDSNIHSPNERILVDYLSLAVRAATELFVSLSKL